MINVEIRGKKVVGMVKIALDTGCTLTIIPWNITIAIGCATAHSKETI